MSNIRQLLIAQAIPIHRKDLINGTFVSASQPQNQPFSGWKKQSASRMEFIKNRKSQSYRQEIRKDLQNFIEQSKPRDGGFSYSLRDCKSSISQRKDIPRKIKQAKDTFGLSPMNPQQTKKLDLKLKGHQTWGQGYFTLKVKCFRIKNKARSECKTARSIYDIRVDKQGGVLGSQICSRSPMNKKNGQNF